MEMFVKRGQPDLWLSPLAGDRSIDHEFLKCPLKGIEMVTTAAICLPSVLCGGIQKPSPAGLPNTLFLKSLGIPHLIWTAKSISELIKAFSDNSNEFIKERL